MQRAVVYDDGQGNQLVRVGFAALQYRTGPLTSAFLDACEAFFVAFVAEAAAAQTSFGCVAIVSGDVGITDPALRDRQRGLIGRLLQTDRAMMATCILGDSIEATAMRAIGRVMVLGYKNLRHVSTIEEAATIMAAHVSLPVAAILSELQALEARSTTVMAS